MTCRNNSAGSTHALAVGVRQSLIVLALYGIIRRRRQDVRATANGFPVIPHHKHTGDINALRRSETRTGQRGKQDRELAEASLTPLPKKHD